MSDPIDCDNCGAPVEHNTQPGKLYPTFDDCPFCREEQSCSGHFMWLDGELDQYGKTKHQMTPCAEPATVYDIEGRDFYCEEGWKIINEGDASNLEEFILRAPDE